VRVETNGTLTVRFEGWERLAALRGGVEIPRSAITALRWHRSYEDPGGAWRSGGTALPRVLYAGRFRRRGEREVWFLRGGRGMVRVRAREVLEVVSDQPDARRVLLTMDEAHAQRILDWFAAGR
jgi:hypothetical protein